MDVNNEGFFEPLAQKPVAWKPDRSGKYLTVVYRDVIPGDEVGAIVDHPKCVIMSWSNAVHDVEQLRNPPQRTWVDLTDEQMWNAYTGGSDIINLDYAKSIVALFKENNV